MDYIFFFKGLAFILVLAVSCLFRGDDSQRLPWRWFGLFALAQGLAAWLSLVAMNLGEASSLITVSGFLQIVSWVCLAEFGRSGMSRVQGRDSGLWLIALLLMLTSLGGLKGWSGIATDQPLHPGPGWGTVGRGSTVHGRPSPSLPGARRQCHRQYQPGPLFLHRSTVSPHLPGFSGVLP